MHLRRERKAPLTLSMQEPIQTSKDGSHLTVLDVVPDDFLLDEDCECREESSRLRTLVQQLTGRERQVILLRYGLSGQPPADPAAGGSAAGNQQKLCFPN